MQGTRLAIFNALNFGGETLIRKLTQPVGQRTAYFDAGGNPVISAQAQHDYAPSISPDGTQVAYVRHTLRTDTRFDGAGIAPLPAICSIRVINYDGTGDREVLTLAEGLWITKVAWAPNASQIAFDLAPQAVLNGWNSLLGNIPLSEIHVVNANGTNPRRLAAAPAAYPTWSPLPPGPEIAIEQPSGSSLVDGGANIGFGLVKTGTSSAQKEFFIRNSGNTPLLGLTATLATTGNPGDFIVTQPAAGSVAGNGFTTFKVTFKPTAIGARTATLRVASNDTDEAIFDIVLSGTGDDHGSTSATATAMALNTAGAAAATASLQSSTDLDWFRLVVPSQASGVWTLTGLPGQTLQVFKAANTAAAWKSGTIAGGATVYSTGGIILPAGTYLARVSGVAGAYTMAMASRLSGDFNADRKADLLWQNASTGQMSLWHMNGRTKSSEAIFTSQPGSGWKLVGTGDFNGDLKPDLALQNPANGDVSLWFMNGMALLTAAPLNVQMGSNLWCLAATGDYNKDGMLDLLFPEQLDRERAGALPEQGPAGDRQRGIPAAVVARFPPVHDGRCERGRQPGYPLAKPQHGSHHRDLVERLVHHCRRGWIVGPAILSLGGRWHRGSQWRRQGGSAPATPDNRTDAGVVPERAHGARRGRCHKRATGHRAHPGQERALPFACLADGAFPDTSGGFHDGQRAFRQWRRRCR